MQGLLEEENWPEFDDETFLEDVRMRLEAVGHELSLADGYWLARSRDTDNVDGVKSLFPLNEAEHAVLAALYLYLRFLPRQSPRPSHGDRQPSVELEDIERAFPAYAVGTTRQILGRLRNLHFVRQHAGRLYPGPYLTLIDEVVADARAQQALRDFKLRSYLREQLTALQDDLDASN
jgi:hypothetical protein